MNFGNMPVILKLKNRFPGAYFDRSLRIESNIIWAFSWQNDIAMWNIL